MKSWVFVILGLMGFMAMAGCATVKSGSLQSLENRVEALEGRLQVVEAGLQSSTTAVSGSESESLIMKRESAVTVENMTKSQIQTALKNAGYYDGEIDGKIGPKTRSAIMDFQKDMGLKADGIAGKITKGKLLKYL